MESIRLDDCLKQAETRCVQTSVVQCHTVKNLCLKENFPLHNSSNFYYTGCLKGNVPYFGRMFSKLIYFDINKNTCIRI